MCSVQVYLLVQLIFVSMVPEHLVGCVRELVVITDLVKEAPVNVDDCTLGTKDSCTGVLATAAVGVFGACSDDNFTSLLVTVEVFCNRNIRK